MTETKENAIALELLDAAVTAEDISSSAAENIRIWLTNSQYGDYVPAIRHHLEQQEFEELNRAFWKVLEFGTGGRRGTMFEIGSAVINQRTMGESAAGLAAYVQGQAPPGSQCSCAIAYDTRHGSVSFAQQSAQIMAAAGFKVYFL
ncbi:MAG: phospho-sugar mutase, partial [Planctomycetales bacterium]